MNLLFRKIDPQNDEEAYAFNLLHEYSWRDSSAVYIPDSEEERRRKASRILESIRGTEQKYLYLAVFNDDEMIASHFLHRMEIDKQPACHIHGLWVHPDNRKLGIAKKLKDAGEAWAKKLGCSFMDSNVRVENKKMISLNEKMGYVHARINFRKPLG